MLIHTGGMTGAPELAARTPQPGLHGLGDGPRLPVPPGRDAAVRFAVPHQCHADHRLGSRPERCARKDGELGGAVCAGMPLGDFLGRARGESELLVGQGGQQQAGYRRCPGSTRAASRPDGPRRCIQVTVPRDEGKKPLVARFGGISLKRQRTAALTDTRPVMASMKRNELIHRLLAECCEICETRTNLEVHHVRKPADLNRPGRRERPAWVHLMAMRRRKALVICRRCHERGTSHRTTSEMITESRMPGNGPARFEGAVGKGPEPRAPRRRPTSLGRRSRETHQQRCWQGVPGRPHRSGGRRHHQALVALARRKINVLYAILRDRRPYEARPPLRLVA